MELYRVQWVSKSGETGKLHFEGPDGLNESYRHIMQHEQDWVAWFIFKYTGREGLWTYVDGS